MDHYKDVIDITLQLVSAVSSLVFCRKQNSESLGNVEKKKVGVHWESIVDTSNKSELGNVYFLSPKQ